MYQYVSVFPIQEVFFRDANKLLNKRDWHISKVDHKLLADHRREEIGDPGFAVFSLFLIYRFFCLLY